eukprot:TRINITY_DN3203_c1_g1_i3.p1 TRINITY_DN3203_c1_g1~~TRINITY_DN3203_c1_g1_i3.p1  ORF type:complete len:757 (+),score=103.62 TRINITY_DN3203_c1_g1_i3:119-2389(+)
MAGPMSQMSAVLYKSLFLQMRQRKSNCAQICVPCVFLFFFGFFNFIFGFASVNYVSTYVNYPSTWNSHYQFYGYEGTLESYYVHAAFSQNKGDDVGTLGNGTNADPTKPSGMLGSIQQYRYSDYRISSNHNKQIPNVPWFEEFSSPNKVDEQIYDSILAQRLNYINDDVDYNVVPTCAVNFDSVDFDNARMSYTLQWDPKSQYENLLPSYLPQDYDWDNSEDNATPQLVSNLISSAFASSVLDRNVTIWSKATDMKSNQTTTTAFNFVPLLGFILIPPAMSFMLPVIVFQFVLEKSHGQLEMAKLKGLNMLVYWFSSFLFYYFFYSILVGVAWAIMWIVNAQIVMDSWTISIPLFMLWGLTQISLGAIFSTMFNSERNATIVSYLMVFLTIGAGICLNLFLYSKKPADWWYHLFPPLTFVRGIYLIQTSFVNFKPVTWEQYWIPEIGDVYMILVLQSVVMLLVAIYLEMVMPRKFGKAESMLFPVMWIWRWFRAKVLDSDDRPVNDEDDIEGEDPDCLEERQRVLASDDFTLKCVRLRKEYGAHVALRSFCIGIENGECFGLLGPNGAGKTTLISSLCGMNTPTSGKALVDGHDTIEEMSTVRKILGYCPQHDILYDDLTIWEHVAFFFRLTGVPPGVSFHVAVMNVIESVGLQDHMHKSSKELSGGMKRRLSIANALVGDPRLLLLDEPTTGLDPESRRDIWDIISEAGQGRSVLLTTHDMVEADTLSTRIGIMSLGRYTPLSSKSCCLCFVWWP